MHDHCIEHASGVRASAGPIARSVLFSVLKIYRAFAVGSRASARLDEARESLCS